MSTINSMDEVWVQVINHGPFEPEWTYGGKPYKYPVYDKANKDSCQVVPWVVAQHHWALGFKEDKDGNPKLVRQDWKEPQDRDSRLESRIATICTKKFHKHHPDLPGHYIDDPDIKEWFLSKVQFKAKKVRQTMSTEAFESL